MIHEGALALAVAILSPQYLTPDQAFGRVWGKNSRPRHQPIVPPEDTADMIKMRATMTFQQIGDLYGISSYAVYNRIRRAQGRI